MRAKTTEGREIELGRKSIEGLRGRLVGEVKARWDPENFFRTNRNVRPA